MGTANVSDALTVTKEASAFIFVDIVMQADAVPYSSVTRRMP